MRLPHRTLPFLLTAVLLTAPLSAQAASSAEEHPLFRLMAHSIEVEGEPRAYFTYRPENLEPDARAPLLLVVPGDQEGALVWAQRMRLLETAKAQGARLVLLEGTNLDDQRVLDRVLDEVLDQVG